MTSGYILKIYYRDGHTEKHYCDYYKKEIIPWAWEFVTEVLKLDKDRLWITIFETDDEAFEIWRSIGVPAERIKRKGKKESK